MKVLILECELFLSNIIHLLFIDDIKQCCKVYICIQGQAISEGDKLKQDFIEIVFWHLKYIVSKTFENMDR